LADGLPFLAAISAATCLRIAAVSTWKLLASASSRSALAELYSLTDSSLESDASRANRHSLIEVYLGKLCADLCAAAIAEKFLVPPNYLYGAAEEARSEGSHPLGSVLLYDEQWRVRVGT
jgi:hypothetical protein